MIIQENLYDSFVKRLVNAYKQVTIGDPLKADTLMGPVVDASAVEIYKNAIKKIKETGGEVLYGGNAIENNGFFVEPTIVKAKNEWEIVQNETFAPILYLIKYSGNIKEIMGI